jgi:SAM-dependent methyltransferase
MLIFLKINIKEESGMDTIEKAKEFLKQYIEERPVKKITFSAPLYKNNPYFKITVQPMQNKSGVFYQFALYFETKVKHENYPSKDTAFEKIDQLINQGYKQCDVIAYGENIKIVMNKNKSCKIIMPKATKAMTMPEMPQEDAQTAFYEASGHNAAKQYILQENTVIPFLIGLGIMDNDGKVVSKYYKKFRQLNKFLELVDDMSENIPESAEIIDVGCGKSYLTFALYYYLNHIKNKNVMITGLDIKEDVVLECRRLADLFGFANLNFVAENIETYVHPKGAADMVISLHACDTATDYALYAAVKWQARLILSVPCCQHELFKQLNNDMFHPLLKHGILKERFSAVLTDTLRAQLLESVGYQTSVIEFIDMMHTPKNIMIRAVRKNKSGAEKTAFTAYQALAEQFGVAPTLFKLFFRDNFLP